MPEQTRQLAAIMFTDIVGHTALMGQDEQKAFEILKINREIQKPLRAKGVLVFFKHYLKRLTAILKKTRGCRAS